MIILSDHARDRVTQRGIALEWIEMTIESPDWVAPDADPDLRQSFRSITANGGRILKVVHRPERSDILVVTAHFDRGARRP